MKQKIKNRSGNQADDPHPEIVKTHFQKRPVDRALLFFEARKKFNGYARSKQT